jgi:hypothetical protein
MAKRIISVDTCTRVNIFGCGVARSVHARSDKLINSTAAGLHHYLAANWAGLFVVPFLTRDQNVHSIPRLQYHQHPKGTAC